MDVRTRRIGVQKKGKHNAEAQRRGGFSERRTQREKALVHFRAGRERAK
jgi:hypothetical protein